MEPLRLIDLAERADEFDALVAQSPQIDRFCSSSAWVLSAAEALMPERPSATLVGTHGYFAAMLASYGNGVPYLEPLELSWGLACPLIGRDVAALVDEVAEQLARRLDWTFCLIPGVTADGPHQRALARHGRPWMVRRGSTTQRHIANLDGGIDGFLRRRSPNFRRALQKSLRAASAAGIEFVAAAPMPVHLQRLVVEGTDECSALYQRIMAVEVGSWKSLAGVGIAEGPMHAFYAAMLPRLLARQRARVMFARHHGVDVGYILGAVFEGEYRGLQFSYRNDYARYSIGSLCQFHQISALCAEGIRSYDLGTDMEYKARWAEEQFTTELQILIRDR
jgi:Acetyltransferase (GNAT) domain